MYMANESAITLDEMTPMVHFIRGKARDAGFRFGPDLWRANDAVE